MDRENEAHLKRVKHQFLSLVDAKYRSGQAEHGGRLWEKPGIMPNIIDEVIDLVVYVLTLQEQYEKVIVPEDSKLNFDNGGPEMCPNCGNCYERGSEEALSQATGEVQQTSGEAEGPVRLGVQSSGLPESGQDLGGVYVGEPGLNTGGQANDLPATRVEPKSGSKAGGRVRKASGSGDNRRYK